MPSSRPATIPRLIPALIRPLVLSLLLHAAVLGWPGSRASAPQRPAVLEARLLPALPALPAEPLLKNTLTPAAQKAQPPVPLPPPRPERQGTGGTRPDKLEKLDKPREQAAQKKLAEHLYYPEEAVNQGLEGEVRLLLVLDAGGRVLSVELAAGSGHPILDRAAVAAARAMGSLPDAGVRDFILPVVFRLQ